MVKVTKKALTFGELHYGDIFYADAESNTPWVKVDLDWAFRKDIGKEPNQAYQKYPPFDQDWRYQLKDEDEVFIRVKE